MHFQNGKQTQRLRKKEKTKTKTSGFQRGNMGARIIQEVGTNIYTQRYWKSIISKSLWPAEGTSINNVHWSICEKSQIGTVISTSTTESPGCTPQNIQPPKSIILIGKIKIHIKKIKRRVDCVPLRHWGPLLLSETWTPRMLQSQGWTKAMGKRCQQMSPQILTAQ